MLTNDCGRLGVNRKACSSSHSETKPLSGGSPAIASVPTSAEPRHPGHAVDQAAELAETALLGRVQHRAGGEEQQALEERVIERVVERRGEAISAASSVLP